MSGIGSLVPPWPGTYSYLVRAYNACGYSPDSYTDSGTRLSLPMAPANLTASDTSAAGVYLSWQDLSSNVTGFAVYRDLMLVHTTAANVTFHVDHPGDQEPHEYCVAAVNACGESEHDCDMGQVA